MSYTRYNPEAYKKYLPSDFIYNEKDIPLFIKGIYSHPYYTEESKQSLFEILFRQYLTDSYFRYSVQEKKIYFVNNEYAGFLEPNELIRLRKLGNSVVGIILTDNPVILDEFFNMSETINAPINNQGYFKPFVDINFFLKSRNMENRLYDTGATTSTIPYLQYWNHQKQKYNTNKHDLKSNLEYLNSNIQEINEIYVTTGSGQDQRILITWKNDLVVSIGELFPIKIKTMLAPVYEKSNISLIGMDIISMHETTFYTENNKLKLRIRPGLDYTAIRNPFDLEIAVNDLTAAQNIPIQSNGFTKTFLGMIKRIEHFEHIEDDILQKIYNIFKRDNANIRSRKFAKIVYITLLTFDNIKFQDYESFVEKHLENFQEMLLKIPGDVTDIFLEDISIDELVRFLNDYVSIIMKGEKTILNEYRFIIDDESVLFKL